MSIFALDLLIISCQALSKRTCALSRLASFTPSVMCSFISVSPLFLQQTHHLCPITPGETQHGKRCHGNTAKEARRHRDQAQVRLSWWLIWLNFHIAILINVIKWTLSLPAVCTKRKVPGHRQHCWWPPDYLVAYLNMQYGKRKNKAFACP